MYDYSKLRGRILEVCGTRQEFAKRMGLSERTISLKMQQHRAFKQTEIARAMEVLELGAEDVQPYFFTIEVK